MKKRSLPRLKIIFPLYCYPVHVFVVLFIVVMLVFVTQYIQNELYQFYFIPGISVFSALSLITPWIGKYLHKTFLSLQETIETLTETSYKEWFMQQENFVFGLNRWSILTSLLVAIGGEVTNYYLAWGLWSGLARMAYFLHAGLLFAILGFLGWTYFGILLLAYRLRTLNFDLEPFETKKDEFDRLNSSFLGMFGTGVILYVGAVIAAWLVSGSYLLLSMPILRVWIFPFTLAVIGFFVLIQFFLHEVMKKAKKIRINKISLLTRKYYQEWEKADTSDKINVINNLLVWKEKIEKESDYPFDFLTVASVIVTILLPTLKTIMDLL